MVYVRVAGGDGQILLHMSESRWNNPVLGRMGFERHESGEGERFRRTRTVRRRGKRSSVAVDIRVNR